MPAMDLGPNDLLWGLSKRELELVVSSLSMREFAAGDVILRRGEHGDCLYVIETGLVQVEAPGAGGQNRVVAQLGPGQIVGEMALLTGQPRSAQVTALTEVKAYALSVASFFEIAGHSPTMLLNIGRVLAGRLGQMTRASMHHERRALVVLVGMVPAIVGSLLATNLAAGITHVSGRAAFLLDLPAERASRLPGREFSPDLAQAQGGADLLLHLSQLHLGPLTLHVANLPSPRGVASADDATLVGRVIGQVRRSADFIVLNLVGAQPELLAPILSQATEIRVVTPSSALGGPGLRDFVETLRRSVASMTRLAAVVLSGEGATPASVRATMRTTLGIDHCLVMPGQAELLREAATTEPPMVLRGPTLPSSRLLGFLAREVSGMRVGLALGSGAAKGIAHLGVWAALGRLGVPTDCVTGTSIGALVGAGIALGMDIRQADEALGRLVDLWGEALRPTLPRFSLVSSKGLERIVGEIAGDARFDELPIPFGCVATDLNSGRGVNMARGSVALAVRASISIPLIFPPVFEGDYCLVDGFVTNPVPTKLARELGADVILAVNLGRPPDDRSGQSAISYEERLPGSEVRRQSAPNILETYLRCAEIMMAGRGENDCLSADLTLRPRLPQISWREFQKGGAPMEAGERAVEECLAELRELLPWLTLPA